MNHSDTPRPVSWTDLYWTDDQEAAFRSYAAEGDLPGFVMAQAGDYFDLLTPRGAGQARLSGQLSYVIELGTGDFPQVGDFVVARPTGDADRYQLRRVLPRRNSVSRRKPGKRPDEQPVAVNIDLLCIVTSPGVDYSPRRIERYAENVTGELRPRIVVVINKTDLMEDAETFLNRAREDVPMLPVVGVSALNGAGLSGLEEELSMGRVVALVGSSGVGKTSLIRALAEQSGLTREDLRVAKLRRNDKGRHTTSSRRIYPLPSGALLVDLPGMREVQVLGEDGEGAAFADIEALAGECRFRDCRHKSEPGCAVKAAVEAGEISSDRYESYLQLQYEASTNRAERVRQRQKIGMAIAKANRRRKKGQRF